jgi:DNA-binding CsgD family transcriptional regulator
MRQSMAATTSNEIAALGTEMLKFACSVDSMKQPDEVLDCLHQVSYQRCKINVLLAGMFPLRWGDFSGVELGKTVFLHDSAPQGWWEEWLELSRQHPSAGLALAQLSISPFIRSELMQRLEPLGLERWPVELALKYGMRDGLTCPVGGRWVIAYWSSHVLSQNLSDEGRAILFMGATFAAIRLQKIIGTQTNRVGKRASLTPRELAILRLLSTGHQTADTAGLLGLGEETVRSHMKKAQSKLGVRNRLHAVAQAIRLRMIP